MAGPYITDLTIGGFPGTPSVTASEALPGISDTWSLALTAETSSVVAMSAAVPVSDSWALTATEKPLRWLDLPTWATDLSLMLRPAPPDVLTDKAALLYVPYNAWDTLSVTWTEEPFDTVTIDSFDIWKLAAADVSSTSIQQSYPLSDQWAITLSEVSTLSITGGTLYITPNDSWTLTGADVSALWKDIAQPVDTWSVSLSVESSGLLITTADRTDTWSISYSSETSALDESGAFVVDVVDGWSLAANDISALAVTRYLAPSDSWALSAAELAALVASGTMDLTDTWTLDAQDVSTLVATPMFTDLTDTWSLSTLIEDSQIANVPTIPIPVGEQWMIAATDIATLHQQHARPVRGRRIGTKGPIRRIKV